MKHALDFVLLMMVECPKALYDGDDKIPKLIKACLYLSNVEHVKDMVSRDLKFKA